MPDRSVAGTGEVPWRARPRLIITDLDGTLLDENGAIPETFWEVLDGLRGEGIEFAVASGRQYATMAGLFESREAGITFIAENGTYVVRDGKEQSATPIERQFAEGLVRQVRDMGGRRDVGAVWCGRRAAYIERADAGFYEEVARYYVNLEVVPDLLLVKENALKLAVFDFSDAERSSAPELRLTSGGHQVVVSSKHWIDIMAPKVNKGVAVRALRRKLGISKGRTAVFGDYLNDLEMLDEGALSFAVSNAHPEVIRRARWVVPTNREHGVITTMATWRDQEGRSSRVAS